MNKKIYKGYELIKAIEDEQIEEGTIIEILEDNTEEIEELKYDVVDENGRGYFRLDTVADKVNELVKAINELKKVKE